ncbi:hypothetical protein KR018_012043 [Drosophila ironensis]|nr:hypothetical protein KR018_012043 [Drosophila ironensis]
MILTATFVCFCLASAFNYLRTRRQRGLISNLRGPFAFPLVGSMHKLLFLRPTNFLRRSQEYLSQFGSFSRIWIFHRLFIPVSDLELSRQLLESEQHLETGYELMRDWLGGGVLMCSKDKWRQRHGLYSGLFANGNFAQLSALCCFQGKELRRQLADRDEQEVFEAWELVAPSVLSLMVQVTCGVSPSERYAKALADLSELYRQRFLSLSSANRFNYWIACPLMRRRQNKLIKILNEEHRELVARCRGQREQQTKVESELSPKKVEPLPSKWHASLLDVLLDSAAPQLTEEEICAELNTCNYLGYLLCSSALCFSLVTIARNPSVQHRCLEELTNAQMGDLDWKLDKLPYLDAVVQETLRLYPPQVILGRQLSQDFAYTHSEMGDASLPLGAEIYIDLYELQRNEDRYPNANHFQPERFMESPPELLSFSLGPRSCPARKFTINLLKAILAPIITKFELLPYGNDLGLDLRLVLGSSKGFQLALKLRNPLQK